MGDEMDEDEGIPNKQKTLRQTSVAVRPHTTMHRPTEANISQRTFAYWVVKDVAGLDTWEGEGGGGGRAKEQMKIKDFSPLNCIKIFTVSMLINTSTCSSCMSIILYNMYVYIHKTVTP